VAGGDTVQVLRARRVVERHFDPSFVAAPLDGLL
jgi:hypothetical protein